MKTFITQKYIKPYHSSIFNSYFSEMKVMFFDIETTGLSPEHCKTILIGMGRFIPEEACEEGNCTTIIDDPNYTVTQLFADEEDQEQEVLEAFLEEIKDVDVLVSFNGTGFDIPFVRERCKALGLPYPTVWPYSFDIYQIIKKGSELKGMLPNLRQKTVEDYMGLWSDRKDEINGGESVYLYYEYLSKRSTKTRGKILLHNLDDVAQMARLMEVLRKCDLHRALFYLGVPFKIDSEDVLFIAENIKLLKKSLKITGHIAGDISDYVFFDFPEYGDELKISDDGTFEGKVKLYEGYDIKFIDVEKSGMNRDIPPSLLKSGYLVVKKDSLPVYRNINIFCKVYLKEIRRRICTLQE